MTPRLTAAAVGVAVVAGLAVAIIGAPAAVPLAAQSPTHTVYVSAVDKDDAPVTDMQAADFELKEGGKVQQIQVKPASAPLRVAILVADWGTGNFQAGLSAFMNKLMGHAEFSLISLLPQPIKVVDYTSEAPALSQALGQLGSRGRQTGAQLLEGIRDTAKTIGAPGKRPVIVVLRIGSEGVTSLSGEGVRAEVRKSGAILEVISAGLRTSASQTATGPDAMTMAQNQLQDDERKQSDFALAQVLGDGSKETGGRNEQVISTTLISTLENIANELLHQYEITYTLPAGQKPNEKISVESKRKGVTVRAPSRIALN
jgi:VWFA-related protein